jgi:hypothetical protein
MSAACEQLSPFLDGELSAPDMDSFRDHLDRCGECRDNLRATWLIEQALLSRRRDRKGLGLVVLVLALLAASALGGVVFAGGLW